MEKILSSVYEKDDIYLKYYEICSDNPPLVLIHAQGVDSESFFKVMPKLAKKYHVYAVDCYGHGGSLHDASKYNVVDIGNAVIDFIQNEIAGAFLRWPDCGIRGISQQSLPKSDIGRSAFFFIPGRATEKYI